LTYGLQQLYFSTSGNSTIKVWLQVAKDLKTISYINNISLKKYTCNRIISVDFKPTGDGQNFSYGKDWLHPCWDWT